MAKPTPGRIKYPANIPKLLALAERVYNKHQNDGADSPLHALQAAKWEDLGPQIAAADALHREAEALSLQMEAKYAERDLLMKPLGRITRASGAYLKALHRGNPHALGAWGYNVDSAPRKAHKKKGI